MKLHTFSDISQIEDSVKHFLKDEDKLLSLSFEIAHFNAEKILFEHLAKALNILDSSFSFEGKK